jgi:two-component system, cell cycle response regulator DivK
MEIPDFKNRTVLIVEDDEMCASFILEIIEVTGAKTIHAINAADAIYLVQDNNFIDIVLMDIQLPDMNGWQATKIIKKVKKELPVIIQSAFSLETHIKKSVEAGCDFFIPKPIDIYKLYDAMEKAITQYQN